MRGASTEIVIASLVVTGLVSIAVTLLAGRFADQRQRREERSKRLDLAHAEDQVDLEELRETVDDTIKKALATGTALDDVILAIERDGSDGVDKKLHSRLDKASTRITEQAWLLRSRIGATADYVTFAAVGKAAEKAVTAVENGDAETVRTQTEEFHSKLEEFVSSMHDTVGTPLNKASKRRLAMDYRAAEDAAAKQLGSHGLDGVALAMLGGAAAAATASALGVLLVLAVAARTCQSNCARPIDALLAGAVCGLIGVLAVSFAVTGRRPPATPGLAAAATGASALWSVFAVLSVTGATGPGRHVVIAATGLVGVGTMWLVASGERGSVVVRRGMWGAVCGVVAVALVVLIAGPNSSTDPEAVAWATVGVHAGMCIAAAAGLQRVAPWLMLAGSFAIVTQAGCLLWLL